jgi:hypothetical protein
VSAGAGGPNTPNLKQFAPIPTFDGVSDIDNTNGFIITVGQIQSNGSVVTAAGGLTTPENYFFFTSSNNAITGNINGGGSSCSAGPVTLGAV